MSVDELVARRSVLRSSFAEEFAAGAAEINPAE